MNIAVIGGGVISKKLVSTSPDELNLTVCTVRNLSKKQNALRSCIKQCADADVVVFLGYHHRDLIFNVRLLWRVLALLNANGWKGQFVFFNTQSVMASQILRSPIYLSYWFRFDTYTVTKRIQSKVLSWFSKKINIVELFLPVVIGVDTKAQRRFQEIACHAEIFLPNKGANKFAYIDIDVFANWFWNFCQTASQYSISKRGVSKLFIYEDIETFAGTISNLRKNLKNPTQIKNSLFFSLTFHECKYKYQFADDAWKNLRCALKMTPIWLVLSILRNEFKKITVSEWNVSEVIEPQSSVDTPFLPIGSEYQYLSTNIDLDMVPVSTLKVDG